METIVQELTKRKQTERIRYFEPTEPPDNDQRAFIYSDAKERWAFGGNRSGKTEVGMADLILFATGKHPVRSLVHKPPVNIRVVSTSWEDGIKEIIIPKFWELVKRCDLRGGSWDKAYSPGAGKLWFKNGSNVKFMTSEQAVNKHGGVKLHAVYFDEHHPEPYYKENIMRLTDFGGYLVGLMTPEEGVTWEADHVENPPPRVKIEHWFFDTDRNPFLSKKGVEDVIAMIKDPRQREAKLHGRFIPQSGMVYPLFNREKVVCSDFDIPDDWPRVFCIDPHLRKPSALMWVAWHPKEHIPFVYRTHKVKKTVDELAKFIKVKSTGEKISLWIADEAQGGQGENIFGTSSVIEELNQRGIPVVGTNQSSDKSFKAGVDKIQELLTPDPISGVVGMKIFESCCYPVEWIDGKRYGSLIWEFGRYRFRKEQKSDEETFREKVATVDDDYLSDLRYIVQAGFPGYDEPVQVVSSEYDNGEVDPITGW